MVQFRNVETALEIQRNTAGVFELASGEVLCASAETDYTYTIQHPNTGYLILIAQGDDARYNLTGTTSATSNWLPQDVPTKVRAPMNRYGAEGMIIAGRDLWSPAGLKVHFWIDTGKSNVKITVIETPGAAPGTYLPTASQDLMGWYAAHSILNTVDGTKIDPWRDLSGNLKNLTRTGTADPVLSHGAINGHPAILFNGTNNWLLNSSFSSATQPLSFHFVAQPVTWNVDGGVIYNGGNFFYMRMGASDGNMVVYAANTLTSTLPFHIGVPRVYSILLNSANSYARYNGTQHVSGDAGTGSFAFNSVLQLGVNGLTTEYANVLIGELAVFNRALSTYELEAIEKYMASRYDIQLA